MTTIYIHKYALTAGIIRKDVEVKPSHDGDRSYVDMGHCQFLYEGKDWSLSEEEAIAIAEKAREKKIVSLKNQLTKLNALKITVKDQD